MYLVSLCWVSRLLSCNSEYCAEYRYNECRYAECSWAECRGCTRPPPKYIFQIKWVWWTWKFNQLGPYVFSAWLNICEWGLTLSMWSCRPLRLIFTKNLWASYNSCVCVYICIFTKVVRGRIHNISFSFQPTNGPNKPGFLSLASLSNPVYCNTLAYWAHSYVMKKMKCCECGPRRYLVN
jgi:hypothetical protein